ncbi:hypothetical protein DOT_1894 [Desulfosporosinus sp. OT]|nr:hypothetical protein DOT_1894 [Desulfosporosinus sp. OT]
MQLRKYKLFIEMSLSDVDGRFLKVFALARCAVKGASEQV